MYQWQAIHQNRYVIAISSLTTCWCVLTHHLQLVLMYMLFIEQHDVLHIPIVKSKIETRVFLYHSRFLYDATIGLGDTSSEEAFPLAIVKTYTVQLLQLLAKICDEFLFCSNAQILILLHSQLFHIAFTHIGCFCSEESLFKLSYNSAFVVLRN